MDKGRAVEQAQGTTGEGAQAVRRALAAASRAAGALVIVDLAALRRNYRVVKAAARGAECAGVVKADAYGLGLRPVVGALLAEGCRSFFVATLAEARAVRETAPGAAIHVLNGLFPGAAADFLALRAIPVLGGVEEAVEWRRTAGDAPAALQIDTGMNRLGLNAAALAGCAAEPGLLSGLSLALVMSHLACADDPAHPGNRAQRDAFAALAARVPVAPLSLANSGGVFLGDGYHFDMVRSGIALYGGAPHPGVANPMEPVVQIWGRIAQFHQAAPGETVGYGAARRITRPTRIAILSVGYADGYCRALGSRDGHDGACAWFGGRRAPILGRVSMDLAAFDVTDIPERLTRRGGFAELLGPHTGVDELAACAGTISYEVLTNIGRRAERVYVNG